MSPGVQNQPGNSLFTSRASDPENATLTLTTNGGGGAGERTRCAGGVCVADVQIKDPVVVTSLSGSRQG